MYWRKQILGIQGDFILSATQGIHGYVAMWDFFVDGEHMRRAVNIVCAADANTQTKVKALQWLSRRFDCFRM
jgi:hypothetical protein